MLILSLPFALVIGAALGWGRATRRLYRRPGSKFAGDDLVPEEMSSRRLARRKRRRWLTTIEFAAGAAALDVLAFYVLMRFVG
jgi:hypothetical protein